MKNERPTTRLPCSRENDDRFKSLSGTTTAEVGSGWAPYRIYFLNGWNPEAWLLGPPCPPAGGAAAASPAASMITTSEAPTTSNNNNNLVEQPTSKRHSLLVTLDDGSTTQTIGSVTKLKDKEDSGGGGGCGTKSQGSPNLSIEEIGHDTLMREIQKTTGRSPSPHKEKAKTKQNFSKYLTIKKCKNKL